MTELLSNVKLCITNECGTDNEKLILRIKKSDIKMIIIWNPSWLKYSDVIEYETLFEYFFFVHRVNEKKISIFYN